MQINSYMRNSRLRNLWWQGKKRKSLKEKEIDKIKRHMFFYVNDTFKKKEEKQKLKCLYKKPKFSSNLIFVIDEWHSKNILKELKILRLFCQIFLIGTSMFSIYSQFYVNSVMSSRNILQTKKLELIFTSSEDS